MSIAIWKRGRRLFSIAAVLMILVAALHTVGNLMVRPDSAEEERVFAEMSSLHFPFGMGMNPSLKDVYWDLVFTMSITFAGLGLINVVAAASPDVPDRILRRMSWVNLLWVGASVVLNWMCRIPPPLISSVILELVVAASLVTTPRSQRS
jgi:hypothetical protein